MNLRERALLAFGLLGFSCSAFAGSSCTPDQTICLRTEAVPGGVALWAESKRPGTITFSLVLEAQNLVLDTATRDFTLSTGTRRIASARLVQPGQPWNLHYGFSALAGSAGAKHDDTVAYALPIAPGQTVRVSQGFHGKISHNDEVNEYAIDFDVPEGTPVYAARDGQVVEIVQGFRTGGANEPLENANVVRIEHADHTVAEYAHLRYGGAAVSVGQMVKKSDLVAYSGNTGRTNGPHLHFAVHVPTSGKSRRSIPIHFATDEGGDTILLQGKEYRRATESVVERGTIPVPLVSNR